MHVSREKPTVAEFVAHHINKSTKSRKTLALEAGFPRPNVISMLKTGATKVPLERIPALAAALEIDELELLSLCLQEYQPGLWAVLLPHLQRHDLQGATYAQP